MVVKGVKRGRTLAIMTYCTAEQIEAVLGSHYSSVRGYCYIYHDKDESEPHRHVIIRTYDAWSSSQICKWFELQKDSTGKYINTFCEVVSDIEAMMLYILHQDKESIEAGKHRYEQNDIVDRGLYLFQDNKESADNTFEILQLLDKGVSLRWLLRVYGRDLLYHYNQYKELLADVREQERYKNMKEVNENEELPF